jgi:hypothetical protein
LLRASSPHQVYPLSQAPRFTKYSPNANKAHYGMERYALPGAYSTIMKNWRAIKGIYINLGNEAKYAFCVLMNIGRIIPI